MAVYGVGIDLVRVERLEEALHRWGERFEKRIFTETESRVCSERKKGRSRCLALRFAAKEAFVKAIGTGMRSPVLWLDIEVRNDARGKPLISLSTRAEQFCRELGVTSWHLSLTDDGKYGAAVVVVEC